MPDLLLEIGTEEIPAIYLQPAVSELKERARRLLDEARLSFAEVRTTATPRRIVLYVDGLAEHQSPLTRRTRGPAARVAFDESGRPTAAAVGFARGQGVDVERLEIEETEAGPYVFAVVDDAGTTALALLQRELPELIGSLAFPKMQRWGDGEMRFARPIRWLLCLLGDQVVLFSLDGLQSGNTSRGHRFLSPATFELDSAGRYWEEMTARHVIVNQEERREAIRRGAESLAAEFQGSPIIDDALLDEVTYLVEYPAPFVGSFDPAYLELPGQVLVSVMQKHQKYFPVADASGNLLPLFVAVRNGLEKGMETVREGNVRVLKARLYDARFFYDEDRKVRLSDRVDSLGRVTFQEKLGSLLEKTSRVRSLTAVIGEMGRMSPEHRIYADRAALLAKADLLTGMVYEFPELQGTMGREYARLEGEPTEVAVGIHEHYLPRFAGDVVPATLVGAAVALADRLDTLAGFFGIGIRPTGSQDPFALRRQGNGVVRLLLETGLQAHLHTLLHEAVRGYSVSGEGGLPAVFKMEETALVEELYAFIGERLSATLSEDGHSAESINAVLAVGYNDLPDLLLRLEALEQGRRRTDFGELLAAGRRVESIVKDFQEDRVDEELFREPVEADLCRLLAAARLQADAALASRPTDYERVLAMLLDLCPAINAFFEGVMVMAEDREVRNNRLSLLNRVRRLFREVADFSLLGAV